MTENELQKIWRQAPPGTEIVSEGDVKSGDYFYVAQLGAWASVPQEAIGQPITPSLVARPAGAPREPVTQKMLDALLAMITKAHGGAGVMISGLGDADITMGRRRLSPSEFEMWTKDKCKITISTKAEGVIVSCSKSPDPEYPKCKL